MTVFAIIGQPNAQSAGLPRAIEESFPGSHFKLQDDAWLVSFAGTVQALCDKLKITNGENGAAVVVEVASYFGRANPNIWSWIKSNWGAT